MSLQVWLPLNGDLHNQGLTNYIFSNNGATVSNDGKIGQCYSFNGSSNYLYSSYNFYNTTYSFSTWIFTTSSSATQNICCDRTSVGSGFAIFLIGGKLRIDCGGNNLQWTTNYTYPINTWFHLTITYDGINVSYYINGIFQQKNAQAISSNYWGNTTSIGASQTNGGGYGNYLNGKLNDVRIYDHCLSNKEIKEIAKGLMLHYKLDDSYVETSNILSCTITDTAYNSPIGKYGYNDDSNLIKTSGYFQGKNCIKVGTRVAGQTARPYVYFNNLFTSDGTNSPAYKALSFDYYTTIPTAAWLNIYKLGNGEGTVQWKTSNSSGVHSGSYTNSANSIVIKPNEWNHIEVILHGTTAADAQWGYCINGPEHTSNENYYYLYANIQLEQNDHVTGYGANFHSNTVYDSSGYGNNGTLLDAPIISTDSIKYNYSFNFDGINDGILIQNLYLSNILNNQVTYSFWIKPNGESGARSIYFGSYSGTSWSIEKTTSNLIRSYWNGSPDTTCTGTTIVDNEWQHICIVKNGSNDLKIYINGDLKYNNTSINLTAKDFPTTYRIGKDTRSSDGTPYKGNMSDFRIYATALSAEDVIDLYKTSMSIDNNGNTYVRELVEL